MRVTLLNKTKDTNTHSFYFIPNIQIMKYSKSNRNRFHTNLSLQMMLLWSPSLALVVPMFAGTHNIIHPPPFRWNAMDDNTGGCSRISSSTSSSRISSSTSSSSSSSTTSSTPNRVLGFHLHMIPSSSNEEHGRQSRDSSFQRPRSKTSILNKRLDTMTPTTNPKILLQVLDDTNVRVETSHLTHDSKRTRRDDTVQFSSHAATTNLYHNSHVPLWFPYIPTRSQIESLKVIELKDACQERGLSKVCLMFQCQGTAYIYIYICMYFSSDTFHSTFIFIDG
jgi:hypothetical protein